jgi:hypothetical protein
LDARFRHEALLYAGDDEFVAAAGAFVRDAVDAREETLVVVDARKIELLRDALGATAARVRFADMATAGRNPARIIPAWQDFVLQHPGVPLRGIGEPISAARGPDELAECQIHESLLNVAFEGAAAFWLLCPYDVTALPEEVISEARRNHPHVARDGGHSVSSDYRAPDEAPPLRPRPSRTESLAFDARTIDALPSFVAAAAARAGLAVHRRVDLVVAAGEVAAGETRGVARVWRDPGRIVCEIECGADERHPLAGRRLPPAEDPRERALWIANQLCDLVQVRSHGGVTVVRLHAPLD